MRRGLIARSPAELPDAALDARIARVRAAMTRERLDALVVYTNNTRPAGVSWLTGFIPYWSEALVVVPRHGELTLVVALTYRVKTWIERTSRVAKVIHNPRIGREAASLITALKPDAAVGIVELDQLSAGIADDFRACGPTLAVKDASDLFAQARAAADEAEVTLATTAAAIAHRALSRIRGDSADLARMLASAEAAARAEGAEEIYLAAAPDLARDHRLRRLEGEVTRGATFAVRASVAYKGSWVRLVRTFRDDAEALRRTAETFAAAVARLPDDGGLRRFPAWLVEGCRLTQPLEALTGSAIAPPAASLPALVSVQARIDLDGAPVLLGAPARLGARGAAARLLASPEFA